MENEVLNEFFLDANETRLLIFAGVLTFIVVYVFYKILRVAMKEKKELLQKPK